MIIKFTVGNFKVFRDKTTLDMRPSSISEHMETHLLDLGKEKLLKSLSIYGKNAAGKSKLIHAMEFMKEFTINSSKDMQVDELIDVEPFRLNTATKDAPSFLEIEFILNDTIYRYGFEVTEKQIEKEWLFEKKKTKSYPLFLRTGTDFEVDYKKFLEGKDKESWTRKNALFLSLVAQLNGKLSQEIIKWFKKITFVHHVCSCEDDGFTEEYLENEEDRELVAQMIKNADLNIEDLEVVRFEDSKILKTGKRIQSPDDNLMIKTFHSIYNEKNEKVGMEDFDMYHDESTGTIRYFDLLGFIIRALKEGEIMVMDEMDARLHTKMSQAIMMEFNSKQNTNSQFIFTTHNTNLLSSELLRRDQIYFVEKDQYAASSLHSLSEFKIRKDTNYELNYLKGKYGGIPFINQLTNSDKSKPKIQK